MRDSKEGKLRLGDVVRIDGASYIWERTDEGREAYLLREGTDDGWIVISMPELLRHAGTARRYSNVNLRPEGGDWPADVLDMEKHLLEVFCGRPMDDAATGPRAQYDPEATTLMQRVAAKLEELSGTSLQTSQSTLFRRWADWQRDGAAGLNARMHRSGAKRLSIAKADPRLIDLIDRALDDRVNMPTATRRRCAVLIRRQLEQRFPEDPICDIKTTTLQAYINERDAGRYSFGKATTRRTAANQPKRQYGNGSDYRLGARVEIDSTVMDVQVRDDCGAIYRPRLTMMLDIASRVPVSWAIHAEAPNGFDHALLLARAIVGRKAVPGWEATRLSASTTLPVDLIRLINTHAGDEAAALPWIFPQSITIDGGTDFRSGTFEAACRAYGIDLDLAPPYTPTAKPHIERAFGSVATLFTQWLAGSTGNSVANRGAKDDPVWDIDGIRVLFDVWVTTIYLNTPTNGLRDPRFAGRRWTPNQAYAALFQVGPGVQLPFEPHDFIRLMPVKHRVIDRDGIHMNNRVYDSTGLTELRERRSTGPRGKWDVHFDPFNASTVWVEHPDGGWIECLDRSLDDASAPMVAETSWRLVETAADSPKPEDARHLWLDFVETREKSMRRSRSRRRDVKPASQAETTDPDLTEPVVLSKPALSDRFNSSEIDWDDPAYDIARPRGI